MPIAPPLVLRPLEKTDGPLLADFYAPLSDADKVYFAPHPFDDEHAERLAQEADGPGHITIVAVQQCRECGQTLLAGYIYIRDSGPDKPWWLGICVRPGYRSHGLGRALFAHLFRAAKAAEIESIGLNMYRENARALHLYQKMGFRITDEFINPHDGLPQYNMVKDLT